MLCRTPGPGMPAKPESLRFRWLLGFDLLALCRCFGPCFGEGVQRKSTLARKGRALLGGCVLFAVLGKGEKHGEGRYRAQNGDECAVGLRRGESPAKIFFN